MQTPLRAIWLTTIVSILLGPPDLASSIAANAIFALTAMALDLSYIIPIFLYEAFPCFLIYFPHCCRCCVYTNHPEVNLSQVTQEPNLMKPNLQMNL